MKLLFSRKRYSKLRWQHPVVNSRSTLPVFFIVIRHKTRAWHRSRLVLSDFQAATSQPWLSFVRFLTSQQLEPRAGHRITPQLVFLCFSSSGAVRQWKRLPWPSLRAGILEAAGLCCLLPGAFRTGAGCTALSEAVHKRVGGIKRACLNFC